jgi:GAF domain-containing protein
MNHTINAKDITIPDEIRQKWQNIVNILTKVMKIPVGLIMRVEGPSFTVFQSSDSEGNPFKVDQAFTLPAGIYCEKTMKTKEKNLIPNALKDPEWDKNPSIAAGLISYLGFPIFYPDKNIFGTLCVLDKKENPFSADFEAIMSQFKDIVEAHLALIWQKKLLEEKINEIETLNKMCMDRELKMVELKDKIAKMEAELKQTSVGNK